MTALRNDAERDGTASEQPRRDAAEAPWSQSDMLMGTLIDEIRALRHAYVVAHTGKGSVPKAPEPLPRPGVKRRKTRLTDDQRKMLDPRLRRGNGDVN